MRSVVLILVGVLLTASCAREGQLHAELTEPSPTVLVPVESAAPQATESPTPAPTESPAPSPTPSPASSFTPAPTATTIAVNCRNSTNSACGTFRFDPSAGSDQATTIDVHYVPSRPKAGDDVVFTLNAQDPDSHLVYLQSYELSAGTKKSYNTSLGNCPRAFGPWDPPSRSRGSLTKTLDHTYSQAGTYRVVFTVASHSYSNNLGGYSWPNHPPGNADNSCIDPFADTGSVNINLVVQP